MGRTDFHGEPDILAVSCCGVPFPSGVETRTGDPQNPPRDPHRVVHLLRIDEAESHQLSLAKNTVALLRITPSILNSRFSLRRRRSSSELRDGECPLRPLPSIDLGLQHPAPAYNEVKKRVEPSRPNAPDDHGPPNAHVPSRSLALSMNAVRNSFPSPWRAP